MFFTYFIAFVCGFDILILEKFCGKISKKTGENNMDELVEFAAAINTLYTYIYWEIRESDFIELPTEDYIKLPISERSTTWYVINTFRTKNMLLVDEDEKRALLRVTRLICAISQSLPETSSFRERLLYCKSFLPSCAFSRSAQNN
jgi:hypothetical protein